MDSFETIWNISLAMVHCVHQKTPEQNNQPNPAAFASWISLNLGYNNWIKSQLDRRCDRAHLFPKCSELVADVRFTERQFKYIEFV